MEWVLFGDLLIVIAGLAAGVPLWWIAMRSHRRTQAGVRELQKTTEELIAGLGKLTQATDKQTDVIGLAFRSRIEVEKRETRRKLLAFLEDSQCFTTVQDVQRLTEGLEPALTEKMILDGSSAYALRSLVDRVINLGSQADQAQLLENIAYAFRGLPLALEFRRFRDENKLP